MAAPISPPGHTPSIGDGAAPSGTGQAPAATPNPVAGGKAVPCRAAPGDDGISLMSQHALGQSANRLTSSM
jgi:hypothetical protein